MQPVPESVRKQKLPNHHLRFCILPFDLAHIKTTRRFVVNIGHLPKIRNQYDIKNQELGIMNYEFKTFVAGLSLKKPMLKSSRTRGVSIADTCCIAGGQFLQLRIAKQLIFIVFYFWHCIGIEVSVSYGYFGSDKNILYQVILKIEMLYR